jgi:hypothetical protein
MLTDVVRMRLKEHLMSVLFQLEKSDWGNEEGVILKE